MTRHAICFRFTLVRSEQAVLIYGKSYFVYASLTCSLTRIYLPIAY